METEDIVNVLAAFGGGGMLLLLAIIVAALVVNARAQQKAPRGIYVPEDDENDEDLPPREEDMTPRTYH